MANEFVLHVDGDSFFASCEASLNPRLKGLPVVTGQERGIASSMSKEAKALGIFRGMPVYQIRKLYPEAVILSSDYGVYETFARRMFAIVRRYSDKVEEYSIDECFALLRSSCAPAETVGRIKKELQKELGLTFSLGLADTKVLAKLASSKNKPDGLTILPKEGVEKFLEDADIGKVWGIGPATAQELRRQGIKTALDLYRKDEEWIRASLHKHTREIWHELKGRQIFPVSTENEAPKSIQATRTFTPPSVDRGFLYSELSKNVENACASMRQKGLSARKAYYFLKTQEFRYHRQELVFDHPVSVPHEILKGIESTFGQVWRPKVPYRATGITLSGLVPCGLVQEDLFGSRAAGSKWSDVLKAVDKADKRYGSHTLVLASSLRAFQRRGGAAEKRLNLPYMGEVN